jgi:hypothetical protein
VAQSWDALIWGDYEFVMPLTPKRKWGITYLYQPTFCQQLGIFPPAPDSVQKEFSQFLQKKFRFIQFNIIFNFFIRQINLSTINLSQSITIKK